MNQHIENGAHVKIIRDSTDGGESRIAYKVGEQGVMEGLVSAADSGNGKEFYLISGMGGGNWENRTVYVDDVVEIPAPKAKDLRIEAMAIAMHCDTPDASAPFHIWNGDTKKERDKYRLDAQVGLIAADLAATLTDRFQLDALSPTARILHGGYEWGRTRKHWRNVAGDERSSRDLLPARVTDWGTE